MTAITFTFCLTAGLWGLWHLVEHRASQRWLRWHGVTCLVGLLVAGFCGGREVARTQRNATQPIATQRNAPQRSATQRNAILSLATQPSIAFDTRWGRERENEYLERYNAVVEEIGAPPVPGAVPVLGYADKSGRRYPSRWRMPPNASQTDNLKQP